MRPSKHFGKMKKAKQSSVSKIYMVPLKKIKNPGPDFNDPLVCDITLRKNKVGKRELYFLYMTY